MVEPGSSREARPPPRRGRRSFIKTAIKATAGLVVGGGLLDTAVSHAPTTQRPGWSRDLWEQLESGANFASAAQLKKAIEDQFHILFISPQDDIYEVAGDDRNIPLIKYTRVLDWDAPRLKAFGDVLKTLPPNFYEPKKQNGTLIPMRAILADSNIRLSVFQGEASVYKKAANAGLVVVYEKPFMGQTFLEQEASKRTIIHELTHYATTDNIEEIRKKICEPVDITDLDKLKQLFKANIDSPEDLAKLPQTEERLDYAATNFNEFFAVVGEFYVQGKRKFEEAFSEKIGNESASLLYEKTKEHIFQGVEYN